VTTEVYFVCCFGGLSISAVAALSSTRLQREGVVNTAYQLDFKPGGDYIFKLRVTSNKYVDHDKPL
jgi:hypothetical protein